MNAWAVATYVAIGILIGGSATVFLWFLAEVRRLGRSRPPIDRGDHDHGRPRDVQ